MTCCFVDFFWVFTILADGSVVTLESCSSRSAQGCAETRHKSGICCDCGDRSVVTYIGPCCFVDLFWVFAILADGSVVTLESCSSRSAQGCAAETCKAQVGHLLRLWEIDLSCCFVDLFWVFAILADGSVVALDLESCSSRSAQGCAAETRHKSGICCDCGDRSVVT